MITDAILIILIAPISLFLDLLPALPVLGLASNSYIDTLLNFLSAPIKFCQWLLGGGFLNFFVPLLVGLILFKPLFNIGLFIYKRIRG